MKGSKKLMPFSQPRSDPRPPHDHPRVTPRSIFPTLINAILHLFTPSHTPSHPEQMPFSYTPSISCARPPANVLRDMDVHELRSPAHPRTSLALFCIYFEARQKRAPPSSAQPESLSHHPVFSNRCRTSFLLPHVPQGTQAIASNTMHCISYVVYVQ